MVKRALLKRLGDVDIRLIRIFVAVCDCGGFAASELELNIGRSTISRHIADLESRVGLRLCHRGPAGFALTPEGAQVLDSARRLLFSIDGFQAEVDNIHQTLTGTLRMGLFDQSTTNPQAHLHDAIHSFDLAAPEVTLEISLDTPNVLEAQVGEGKLDIAIVPVHRQSSSFNWLPLYKEHMSLFCGRGHPLFDGAATIGDEVDLTQYKYAGFGFNSPNLTAGQKLGMRRAARVQEEEALGLLILSGCYLGYLADHVAERFMQDDQVRAVTPARTSYSTTFAAITRKQTGPDRKTQEFLRCLSVAHGAERKQP